MINNIENVSQDEGRLKGRKLIIPVFVPHMGCPHDCCFCNQRKISGQTEPPTYESIISLIKQYSGIAPNYGSVEVAFYGGSFTAIPWEEQEKYLLAAREGCNLFFTKVQGLSPFRISTRPDCIDDKILERLKRYGVETIELGVQSMCDEVLKLSGRGHLAEDTVNAARLIKKHGFVLGIQTMPGLPGSDKETEYETARRVIDLKPEIVRIYPTIVIAGTDLELRHRTGEYRPLDLEEAVDICANIVPMYEEHGIRVIRTGLQSSDNISTDGDVVAGPYHPAFGELVKSRMALDFMKKHIDEVMETGSGRYKGSFMGEEVELCLENGAVRFFVPGKMLSQFIGQTRCNIKAIEEMPLISSVKIVAKQ